MAPILGILASSITANLVTNSYESIATFNGTGSSNTITFTSIPSTYKHLQIRMIGRTSYAGAQDDFNLRLNSDSGSNYSQHGLSGNGSSTGAFGVASQTSAGSTYYAWIPGSSAAANIMGTSIIDILDYSLTTKNTTLRGLAGTDFNGSGSVNLWSSVWLNTAAVNSISLISVGNFTTTSSFALYGIRG